MCPVRVSRYEEKIMAGRKPPRRSVFCIETVWYGSKDRSSMRPVFQILEDFYDTPYVYRDAATRDEFIHYVNKWKDIHKDKKDILKYPVLYLGFHGKPGKIGFETTEGCIDLARIKELEDVLVGSCENRLVHFSSCRPLKKKDERKSFLDRTKASAVSGYTKKVDWIDCASFELLYLSKLQEHTDPKLSPNVARSVYGELKKKPLKDLAKHLGFFMEVAP